MVRIPATLVAMVLALVLDIGTFWLADWTERPELRVALWPLWAAAAGFVAARWALRAPQVPGFAIGLLIVAVQLGLGLGLGVGLVSFVQPALVLLQILAAISGGLVGAIVARRSAQMPLSSDREYRAFS